MCLFSLYTNAQTNSLEATAATDKTSIFGSGSDGTVRAVNFYVSRILQHPQKLLHFFIDLHNDKQKMDNDKTNIKKMGFV